ncbi:MAG TPA: extracellular solute-binding protein [Chloroflexota bacterium]|nr:extracellular solute-binding protein [Chloroflexota bacterium]
MLAAKLGGRREPVTRRAALGTLPGTALLLAGLGGTSLGCGQRITKTPVELSWYSWGPQLPLQWTLGPGLNPRFQQFGGPGPQATPVPPEKVLEQQIAPFVADRTDLTIKILTERADRYHDKLKALALAGQLPDVVAYEGTQALPLIRSNLLYHLSRLQGSTQRAFLQRFPAPYLEASMYRGKLYGVPYQARQLVLFVNKTAFEGLSLPPVEWGNSNWSWAHFLEKASALTHRAFGGGYRQFGTLFTGRPMWAALIRQNAGTEFNREATRSFYDSPEVFEALQWAADLVWRYHVAPTEQQNPRGANYTFDNGNVAMWMGYQHAVPLVSQRVYTTFDWDLYPLPMNRRTATYADWGYLSISANTVDVDRAWELLRFLTGPDGDALALRDGVAGPILRGTEPFFMVGSGAGKNKAAAIQAVQQATVTRPLHDAWDQIQSLLDFYLAPVWNGQERAIYAARSLRQAIDGVLAGLETPKGPAVGSGTEAGDAGESEGGG